MEDITVAGDSQENECEQIFETTHSRTSNGRYIVRLPLQRNATELGDSYTLAVRQFHRLERRMFADPVLRENYITFMKEYAALGHMELVQSPYDHTNCYYIPHHAVTTKFRVVFNASAPTSTGVSLNDIQLVGPTLQDSLSSILLRFRRYRVAITADIEKMLRQVLVAPEHRDYQRIIWRESPDDDIQVYRLKTITYGMACSPYNAVRTLQQCARDNSTVVPNTQQAALARTAILTSFYVDDFLTSCESATDAIELATNVDAILSAGQFTLRKWNSNDSQVMKCLANESSLSSYIFHSGTASVLGLRWDALTDQLFFRVDLSQTGEIPTKRRVLSEVARLFDPTGLLAPVVVTGKIFIQRLWSAGLSWDTPLPDNLCREWLKYRSLLPELNQVRIGRWIGMTPHVPTSLHGFCDASVHAYAAVIYTRTSCSNDSIRFTLLTARTKVAPLKAATIPRLELSAALLLAETLQNVRDAMGLADVPYYLWSDSAIVLCWLKKNPITLKPFTCNRVRRIQELTSPARWHHIRSAQNPADCTSRGITPEELLVHPLWWHGPDETHMIYSTNNDTLLSKDESEVIVAETRNTNKMIVLVSHPLYTHRPNGQTILLTERFSTITRLLGTIAIILRWLQRRRHLRQPVIVAQELDDALYTIIRLEQEEHFADEIRHLKSRSGLVSSSRILPLNPFLDENQILRVGGRIHKAELAHDSRFPIILPKATPLVKLLLQQAREVTLHGGTQLMLHTLRRRFWILSARQAVKSFIHNCVICRRHRGEVLTQQMASLPGQRVSAARPFISFGVDYCGPFTLRVGTKRSRTLIKTYLAMFVCMVTKAAHIEVVDDLSARAFLDAFTRFISRRGPCRDLYSDNGTAFVGANRLLKEDLAAWQSENNQRFLADTGTHWHFITPSAPHQGGIWEAAVKSAKHHLIRCVGTQVMWYGQLQTLAVRIEACLNSRPITLLYDDPEDKLALTPGDFLIGSPLLAVPEPDIQQVPSNRLKQWQWIRQLHQRFWDRWSEEYLSILQRRNKWQRRTPNIRVKDIVLVKQENMPPSHWCLGRVISVHPGADGAVRNVTLRTSKGYMNRAVQKLCLLLENEDFESVDSTGQDV
ncbi:uncharacterized protein LOC128921654 [Zeugodacus cucurbitae]|uniref:uncharacterized protein LOC128921654 n=1 Tax=Zeugodacus cucurbitae TaxID=28588 RepID=UPI0023D92AFC|nr:uncharacterized protein LOC128921654 [Zeugodacus cucurbitae]